MSADAYFELPVEIRLNPSRKGWIARCLKYEAKCEHSLILAARRAAAAAMNLANKVKFEVRAPDVEIHNLGDAKSPRYVARIPLGLERTAAA